MNDLLRTLADWRVEPIGPKGGPRNTYVGRRVVQAPQVNRDTIREALEREAPYVAEFVGELFEDAGV